MLSFSQDLLVMSYWSECSNIREVTVRALIKAEVCIHQTWEFIRTVIFFQGFFTLPQPKLGLTLCSQNTCSSVQRNPYFRSRQMSSRMQREFWDYEDKSLLFCRLNRGRVPALLEIKGHCEHSLTCCVTPWQAPRLLWLARCFWGERMVLTNWRINMLSFPSKGNQPTMIQSLFVDVFKLLVHVRWI